MKNKIILKHSITALCAILATSGTSQLYAGGGHGGDVPTVTAEYSTGDEGYLHTGLIYAGPVGDWTLGATYHTVREADGEATFPSLGLQAGYEIGEGLELEGFVFSFLEKEGQKSNALGLRMEAELFEFDAFGDEGHVALLMSPVYAGVNAIDEDTGATVDIEHRMFFTNLTVGTKYFSASAMASWSSFSRPNVELETRTDLEEMTHTAIYENNDGFPDDTYALEFTYTPIEPLSFYLGTANIDFPGLPIRKSRKFGVDYELTHNLNFGLGLQQLTGGEGDNDITGLTVSYKWGQEESGHDDHDDHDDH